MATRFLANGLSEIVHDDEVVLPAKIIPRRTAERVEGGVGGVMNLHLDRLSDEKFAQLIQRHALFGDHILRQNGFRLLIEEVVLRESTIRVVLGNCGSRELQRVENHDDTGNTAIGLSLLGNEVDAEGNEGLQRIAFPEELLT